jgi:hypothetical protein
MTRFKELERIERALRDKHQPELQWAFEYSRSRTRIAPNKRQQKYWRELSGKIEAALSHESSD